MVDYGYTYNDGHILSHQTQDTLTRSILSTGSLRADIQERSASSDDKSGGQQARNNCKFYYLQTPELDEEDAWIRQGRCQPVFQV